MSMSDDVSGAVVGISSQVAQKSVETTQNLVDKTIDNIAKLLQMIFKPQGIHGKDGDIKSSDMTDIKSGEVGMKKLLANAKKNGDSIVATDGFSKADMKFIEKKAKEYGIPVVFTNKKGADNICVHVRGSDKAIFERICTENIQGKLKERPQELDNFKVQRWKIDGIQRELSKYDLNANWGKTKDGDYFCLFEKSDKKAIIMARSEFDRKCAEVEKDFSVTVDDGTANEHYKGFYVLRDKSNDENAISFSPEEGIPSRSELSKMLQEKFGYDENKAEIACAKFGETSLEGDAKREFFAEPPQKEFSDIQNHIELKDESIFVKNYDCLRVTPKADGVPCLIYRDENNNFAVLNPEKMTRMEMAVAVRVAFDLSETDDNQVVDALVDKSEKVGDYYAKQNTENFTHSQVLDNTDEVKKFDNYSKDIENSIFIKKFYVDNTIERHNKDEFSVQSTVEAKIGKEEPTTSVKVLTLSFSDKKNALSELQAMYKEQGLDDNTAMQSAKSVFAKAQAQSAEKVLQIEEIKVVQQSAEIHDNQSKTADSVMTVKYGNRSEEIKIGEREETLSEISDKFGVSEKEAEKLLDKAQEKIDDKRSGVENTNTNSNANSNANSNSQNPINGHERNVAEKVDLNAPKADKPDLPKTELPKVATTRPRRTNS